jgi:hypothetical protein
MYKGHYLGKIRMSPLMYGSLRYIVSKGTLTIDEVLELKQTQLRAFRQHDPPWIVETGDHKGIRATKEGRAALRSYETNEEYFRTSEHVNLTFTSLLHLVLPDHDEHPKRQAASSERPIVHRASAAA